MILLPRLPGALLALAALALPPAGWAQSLVWKNGMTFYVDNTEFFNPYRTGETVLGGQIQSYIQAGLGPRTSVVAGIFGNHLSGGDRFFDSFKPILGFRYQTQSSLGAIGTLVTQDRHGYLEPLQGRLLELTRPIEYGGQWREDRGWGGGEVYLNWRRLNTHSRREMFDYGLLLHAQPARFLRLEFQGHGVHRGGQLFEAGESVANNHVAAVGAQVFGTLPVAGASSVALFRMASHGGTGPSRPSGTPDHGHGTYLRLAATPGGWLELFVIQWWGRDFLSDDGDHSYNSQGSDSTYYRSSRRYQEFGVLRRTAIESGLTLDTELRFHRFDNLRSIAIGTSRWEYSYRLVVRAPFDISLRKAEPQP